MNQEIQTGRTRGTKSLSRTIVFNAIAVWCGVCALAIAVLAVAFLVRWQASQTKTASARFSEYAIEGFGFRLIAKTPELMGPDVPDPSLRLTGNRLSCGSCHLHQGDDPGTLGLSAALYNYPKFSARTAAIRTLEDRVNECMVRSMNGKPLAKNSPQMIAITDWVKSLASTDPAIAERQKKANALPKFKAPNRAANVSAGKVIFEERCATCHGYNGAGRLADNPSHGFIFPALWGPDSFNTGAGMHRLLTAAPFIKARMPLGNPTLTDDQAYDVGAYINSQPRPDMKNLEADFPDKKTKQIDAPYPPFADPFPQMQHQLGPFQPIEAYYKKLAASSK